MPAATVGPQDAKTTAPLGQGASGREDRSRRPTPAGVLLCVLACSLIGCVPAATAKSSTGAPPVSAPATPLTVKVPRTVVTPTDATSIEELFTRARADLAAGRFPDAARGFDRIVELDPDGPRGRESLFDGAAAHDQLGDLAGAASRYEQVARRYPQESTTREALVRAVRLLTYLEEWVAAGRAADVLLSRDEELSTIERIVAYGGKGLSVVLSDDPDAASYFINKGRDAIDAAGLDRAGAVPRDLAQVYFALGELRRIRGERIRFEPMPEDFLKVLEDRCQLLLDAQSAYSDTMRAYDAHWSAMAGFRVGELYQRLHEELMLVPIPKSVDRARAPLFEGAMRLRYAVLLQKGLAMMDHTVALARRTGERSQWTLRAEAAQRSIQEAMRQEEAALARLPYSRRQLEQALEDLGKRKSK